MENDIYSFARERGLNERKVVDVSSGICPCGPSKKVRAAIRKGIKDLHLLPDPSLSRLRRTIASKLGIDGGSLIFANSIEELLHLVSNVFTPGKVLSAGPLLETHSRAFSASGAEVEQIEAEKLSTGPAESGLVFISQPNRITGRLADREWLEEALDFCVMRNNLAVLDESLIEFTGDGGNCKRASRGQGVIVLRSTANFYGLPGLGLAYAVSSPGIIESLKIKKHCEINTLAASAARAALTDKTYGQTARKYTVGERKFLLQSLKGVEGFTCYDSDSNVLLIKTSHPAEKVSDLLAKQGFLISAWKTGEAPGETFFRMSVMGHEKNVKFLRILKRAAGVRD
jgi:histidinol-phosphate/aromatic aminotransferase/cobyric acid decarboxylase-like protein